MRARTRQAQGYFDLPELRSLDFHEPTFGHFEPCDYIVGLSATVCIGLFAQSVQYQRVFTVAAQGASKNHDERD